MKNFSCPLCESKRFIEVRKINSNNIVSEYKSKFNVDVARFFANQEFSTLKCVECELHTHYPSSPGDSDFYDQMQVHPFYYETDKPEFSYAARKIIEKRPYNILEIGCGEGHFLEKLNKAYDVSAMEYSQKSIAKLQNKGIKLDNGSQSYDFVMFFQVLEHVSEVKDFITSAIAKLNTNGYLLITVPNADSTYIQEGASAVLDFPPHHLTQWSKNALFNIGTQFGLDVEDYYTEPLRIEHYMGLISARRNKVAGLNWVGSATKKLGRIADRVLAPYYFDQTQHAGHTHGVLFKKRT